MALLAPACGGDDPLPGTSDAAASGGSAGASGSGGVSGSAGSAGAAGSGGASGSGADSGGLDGSTTDARSSTDAGHYTGPTVGTAKQFAALAYSAVTTSNISMVTGSIGVSAMPKSTITGFDDPSYAKYGNDSLAPFDQLTITAQRDVTALVGNIDPRACDADLTNVVGGLTGDVTLHPGVTCMSSFTNDVLLNGHVILDAGDDPNAFFIIRANNTLTVANGAQVVLTNGAQPCSVFWRVSKAITIGTTAQLYGTFIAGSAIVMNTHATLAGRALAQTEGIHFDANTIAIPSDGAPAGCSHIQ